MSDTENPNPPEDDEIIEDQVEEDQIGDEEGEEEGESGKSGKSDSEAMGAGGVEVTEGFYAYMLSVGAPMSQIAEVMKSWRHLHGKGLLQALKNFAGRKARASAHAEVEIKKDKLGMVESFLDKLKSLRSEAALDLVQKQEMQKQKQELINKQRKNRQNNPDPGQNGPSF